MGCWALSRAGMNKRAKAAFRMAPNRGAYLSIKFLPLRQVDIKSRGHSIKIIECNSYIELKMIVKGFAKFKTSLTNLLDSLRMSSDNPEISKHDVTQGIKWRGASSL
jgi:hypothetical protein